MKKAAVPSVLVLVLLLAVAIKPEAQQLPKIPRIGILEPATSASTSARIEAFRQGLRERAMSKERISSSSTDMRTEKVNAFLI